MEFEDALILTNDFPKYYHGLTIVTGLQFGDEGKGKISDIISQLDSTISGWRPNGGNNAGHTIVFDGVKYKLHNIPATILSGKSGGSGSGTVNNLEVLVQEFKGLEVQGYSDIDYTLDGRAHVIMPWHIVLDQLNDTNQGKFSAGSTKKGIAPCYGAKHERFGLQVEDFLGNENLVKQVMEYHIEKVIMTERINKNNITKLMLQTKDTFMPWFSKERQLRKQFTSDIERIRQAFAPYEHIVGNSSIKIIKHLETGGLVVAENAQAGMLSVNNAYYPRGTSSETSAAGTWTNLNLQARSRWIGDVIGVAKAYCTRVGSGPFITQIHGDLAEKIQDIGHEFGTTTGRRRQVGWFDVPMIKETSRVGGDYIALTKIDVLGGLEEVKICLAYELNGKTITDRIPNDYENCTPIYETFPGWKNYTATGYRKLFENGIDNIKDNNLRKFLKAIEINTGMDIGMISFSPDRKDLISYISF